MTDNQLASNALGSAFAGIIARSFTHPLDTVKARLQASSQYSGVWDVFQTTMKSEGILGFYRGFSTVIVGGTPGTILYLCSYDLFKEKLLLWSVGSSSPESSLSFSQNHNTHFSIHFVSGISAEAVACLIYVPVDVIKERLQVQQLNKEHKSSHQLNKEHKSSSRNTYYKGGWDALQKIARNEGLLSGIYKGYGATLASFGPFSAFYFVFYERFKVWSQEYLDGGDAIASNSDLPFHWILFSSASAGALASWITSPLVSDIFFVYTFCLSL